MEAEEARGHVEQYKIIAQGHEQALAELNSTYDEYRKSIESASAQKDVGHFLAAECVMLYANVLYRRISLLYRSVYNL